MRKQYRTTAGSQRASMPLLTAFADSRHFRLRKSADVKPNTTPPSDLSICYPAAARAG